jgi:ankyrin repeat protein
LIAAATNGNHDLAQALISHDADLNQRGFNQMTALMTAAQENNITIVKLLLINGALHDL